MRSVDNAVEAVIRYGDADFKIVKNGGFVTCAVTGRRIPLNALRYWSVEQQEAYADAEAATARWKQLQAEAKKSAE
jgi:hypothetical protein